MSNFAFFHNVFYVSCILKSFNSHISIVVCNFFKFGMVSKWCIREWVKQSIVVACKCFQLPLVFLNGKDIKNLTNEPCSSQRRFSAFQGCIMPGKSLENNRSLKSILSINQLNAEAIILQNLKVNMCNASSATWDEISNWLIYKDL